MAPQTTQVTRNDRHNQNISPRTGSTHRYCDTRFYVGRQYGTLFYGGTGYNSSSGYNNYYSSYTPTYGYNASMVAAVQRRLGQLGYYSRHSRRSYWTADPRRYRGL